MCSGTNCTAAVAGRGHAAPPALPPPPGSSFKGAIVPECTAMAEENKSQRYSESERVSPALQKEL